jgi:hypothetical protein
MDINRFMVKANIFIARILKSKLSRKTTEDFGENPYRIMATMPISGPTAILKTGTRALSLRRI